MKYIIMLLALVPFAVSAQVKLTPEEQKIVEEAYKSVNSVRANKPTALSERMQSEFGSLDEDPMQPCRYELEGEGDISKSFSEKKKIKFDECQSLAEKALKDNSKIYYRVLMKHGNHSVWKVIDLEDLK